MQWPGSRVKQGVSLTRSQELGLLRVARLIGGATRQAGPDPFRQAQDPERRRRAQGHESAEELASGPFCNPVGAVLGRAAPLREGMGQGRRSRSCLPVRPTDGVDRIQPSVPPTARSSKITATREPFVVSSNSRKSLHSLTGRKTPPLFRRFHCVGRRLACIGRRFS
jgi:hypothetical protein